MGRSLEKLRNFLAKDIWEVAKKPISATETSAEVSKTGLELVVALGLFGSPLAPAGVAIAGLSCVGLATKGIKFYLEKTAEQPTLEGCVTITSRLAYLESLERIVSAIKDEDLQEKIRNIKVQVPEELQQQTDDLQLTSDEAREAITCFRETKLADDFNRHLSFFLKIAGISTTEAEILTQRVSWNTQRYMNQALAEVGDVVKSLSGIFSDGYRRELEKYHSIDDYLEGDIARKPKEQVFAENFTFADIYVPLKAQPLDKNGDEDKSQQAVDLESWVKELIYNRDKQDKVIFIQGEPGRGKSVFCRMFADWVRQNLYPIWIPVLIRLRDIRTIEKQFENTLKAAVDRDFAINDDGWLTDKNTRYLFLLDGFDELLMEGRTSGGLEEFIKQVGSFQESCHRNPEKGHRVLITGRTLALQSIERNMPENLGRVKILAMDGEIQKRWFCQWEAQVGVDKTIAFQEFLDDENCPEGVRELAGEPLLLYLLAAMHRDGELTAEMFAGSNGTEAKILIYQKSLEWVLTKQRPEKLQRNITEQDAEDLRRILTEAGFCVIQSGDECASMSMIEQRLKGDEKVIGVDFGRRDIAVTSNGDKWDGKQINNARDKYSRVRASLQQKATKGTRSTRRRTRQILQRLSGKERRFQQWLNHNISQSIIQDALKNNAIVAIEDLTGIRERTNQKPRNKTERRRSNSWSFYQLRSFLEYKAIKYGVEIIAVPPAYTSQTCHNCLHIGLRSDKRFKCRNCQWCGDADLNGAKNIAAIGAAFVNQPRGSNGLYCSLSTDSSGLLKAHTVPQGQCG